MEEEEEWEPPPQDCDLQDVWDNETWRGKHRVKQQPWGEAGGPTVLGPRPPPLLQAPAPAYRQGLLLHRPPLFLLHALLAALADPQRHFPQEVLHERWHEVRRQPLAGGNQPVVGRPPPVLALAVAQQAARLHRLVGGGQPLRRDTRATSQPRGTARHGTAPGQPSGRWHQTGALLAGYTWVRARSQRGRAASGLRCASWEHRSPREGHERQCHQQQHHASLRGHQQLPLHLRHRGTEGTPRAEQDPWISPCRAGPGVPQPPRSLLTHRRPSSPAPTPPEPPRPPLCSAHPSARMRQGGEQPPGALCARGGRVRAGSPVRGPHPAGSPVAAPSPALRGGPHCLRLRRAPPQWAQAEPLLPNRWRPPGSR